MIAVCSPLLPVDLVLMTQILEGGKAVGGGYDKLSHARAGSATLWSNSGWAR